MGAACFGSGLLRLRLVQQERHAQVLGWFLCGHDDGSGLCHGSNDYCRLAAAAPFSDESGGEVTLSTPNKSTGANVGGRRQQADRGRDADRGPAQVPGLKKTMNQGVV